MVETLPFIPWQDFLNGFRFRQGEHVTLLGPTGSGKTTLANEILPRRRFVIVFGTKRKDAALTPLKSQGYKIERKWPPSSHAERVILWPPLRDTSDIGKQREAFARCLQDVYRSGGWTLYVDEIRYITDYLKLSPLMELLWQQGRSINITIVGGTQRPAHIPLVAYDQATHLFIFKNSDARNIKRLGEIGAFDANTVADEVRSLRAHEVLYLDTRKAKMVKTMVERSTDARSR